MESIPCPAPRSRSPATPALHMRIAARFAGSAAPALLLAALGASPPAPAAAQAPDSVPAPRVQPVPLLGDDADERLRVEQLTGDASTDGYLIRSASSRLLRRPGPARALLAPRLDLTWNSEAPFSLNDGVLWAGRGLSTQVTLGAHARWGPLSLVLAPQLVHQANRPFEHLVTAAVVAGETPPWYRGSHSIDTPLRPAAQGETFLHPGQSTLSLGAGPLAVGASTENGWWGPGIRNAIVLSNHAGGFPHLFLGTRAPVRTPLGSLEARLLGGWLSESAGFDTVRANDVRSISAVAVTLRPAFEPDLTLGVARSVQGAVRTRSAAAGHLADALSRWGSSSPGDTGTADRQDRIWSVFGRWVFPGDGLEAYGEWARQRSSVAGVFPERESAGGYTVGLQGVRGIGPRGLLRLQSELTTLEQPSSGGAQPSFYTSPGVPQGYTQRGQVIGAAIGPGSSSQWLAADYLDPRWRVGVFGGRIRWDNDAFYATARAQIVGWPFLAHDVSVFGGLRGSVEVRAFRLEAEWTRSVRYNYLFQNRGNSWETADDAVDVRNHTLRLAVTAGSGFGRAPGWRRGRASAP
ncbi:MAG: capsule assembly Wzi family protein [Longimicrobiaceae bacterium]